MLRKAVVTLAIGEEYGQIWRHTRNYRHLWSQRHGWDEVVIDRIPDDFMRAHASKKLSFIVYLYKLSIPQLVRDYDMVAFMDCDTVVNPQAPCLTDYASSIPEGGFAACQVVDASERWMFPHWRSDYYVDCEVAGLNHAVKDRKRHVNAGLMLFRPREVEKRWLELQALGGDMNEENRLNVYELQEGRVFELPKEWNVLWWYEKHRLGFLKPAKSVAAKVHNRLRAKFCLKQESALMLQTLSRCHLLHVAFEHKKLLLLPESGGILVSEAGRMPEPALRDRISVR